MKRVSLSGGADLDGFRGAVRALLAEDVAPDMVFWSEDRRTGDLFEEREPGEAPVFRLPRAAADLIRLVVCHRDAERFALLYRLIWRVIHGERSLPQIASDPLVHRLERMASAVRRDRHKTHAFVRFRQVQGEDRFVAWFEPDHHIVELAAPFFVERFPAFAWSILTPVGSAHWDKAALHFGPPGRADEVPTGDSWEEGWRTYYASSFNPARVNPRMMMSEMPKKYWRNLPEAELIPGLIQQAPERVREMIARQARAPRKRSPKAALAAMRTRRS